MNVSLNATVSAPEAIISCIRTHDTMRHKNLHGTRSISAFV